MSVHFRRFTQFLTVRPSLPQNSVTLIVRRCMHNYRNFTPFITNAHGLSVRIITTNTHRLSVCQCASLPQIHTICQCASLPQNRNVCQCASLPQIHTYCQYAPLPHIHTVCQRALPLRLAVGVHHYHTFTPFVSVYRYRRSHSVHCTNLVSTS